MKIPRPLIALVVVGTIITAGVWLDRRQQVRRSILSGTFESQPILVSSRIGGRVAEILAKEGDALTSERTIIRLETTPDQAQTEALAALANQAGAKKAELVAGRTEEIARQRAVISELESTLLKARRGARPEEIRGARAAVAQAKARLDEAERGPRLEEIARAVAAENEARIRFEKVRRGPSDADLQKLRSDIVSAHAQEVLAGTELERRRVLVAEGAIAQKLLDQAVADFVSAQKRREAAEATLRAVTPRPEDVGIAEAQLRQAGEALKLLRAGSSVETIVGAREALKQAQANLDLLLAGSRAEDITAAEARLAQAKVVLSGLEQGSRVSQVEQATSAKNSADLNYLSSQARSAEGNVLGRTGTVIERILVAKGDLIAPGQTIARLADPSDLHLRLFIPESALAKVKIGDEAALVVDGIHESFLALVESISTQGEFTPANLQTPEERGKQVFAVRLRLKPPDARIRAGMAVTVTKIGSWELPQ